MLTLGINAYGHDPAVAFVMDGEARFFLEEERCTRVKHAPGAFPALSLAEGLRALKIGGGHVDAVGYPFRRGRYFAVRSLRHGLLAGRAHAFRKTSAVSWKRLFLGRDVARVLARRTSPPRFLDHHLCHAASAFFSSPFESAAALTVDGAGEDATIAIHRCQGKRIDTLHRIAYPHSLGAFYSSVALHLGFGGGSPEGKMMGLAAYGAPEVLPALRRIVRTPAPGQLVIDLDYFSYPGMRHGVSHRFARELGRGRRHGDPIDDVHRMLAASAQARLEEVMLELARFAFEITGEDSLCLAGGVALNSVANGRILRESGCRALHVCPAAHDAGAALGAAWLLAAEGPGFRREAAVLDRASLGTAVDGDDMDAFVKDRHIPHRRVAELPKSVAKDIAEGRVVALHSGRDEAGPRALGNRSLLACPRRASMRDHINLRVKRREDFRPFAPMVRREDMPAYFGCALEAPYMLVTVPATDLARESIPAALHVDGSARVQTVSRHASPLHWDMLSELGLLTGVPVCINTSFNVQGEPLVHTLEDAYRCFHGTAIDVLYLGPYRIDKSASLPEPDAAAAALPSAFRTLEQ